MDQKTFAKPVTVIYRVTVIASIVLMQGRATQQPQRPTFKLSDFRSSTLKELPYDSPPQTDLPDRRSPVFNT
ncbi:hypothetical protein [Burkholderia sp. LMG 21824]|uniref:hypothetical protein n=1 Tax=Burkholderia sp. LMG 21824 TaxID=3158172 RepID=UPI003C2BA2A3